MISLLTLTPALQIDIDSLDRQGLLFCQNQTCHGLVQSDTKDSLELAEFRKSVRTCLGASGRSYSEIRSNAHDLLRVAREEIANTIGPSLNESISRMGQDNYEERKSVANWVNNELRLLCLGVKHPTNNRPSRVYANPTNGGRFQFAFLEDTGIRHILGSRAKLEQLQLTPMDPPHYTSKERRGRS